MALLDETKSPKQEKKNKELFSFVKVMNRSQNLSPLVLKSVEKSYYREQAKKVVSPGIIKKNQDMRKASIIQLKE